MARILSMATPRQPAASARLIEQLTHLPGIGPRSAERIAFHLLKQPESDARQLAQAILDFRTQLKACSTCGNVSETDPCPICNDASRDASILLVVERPLDIASIEATGQYRGLYHVLMGRIAPMDRVGPGDLNLAPLFDRIEHSQETDQPIEEVILGLNPTLESDGTALQLAADLEKHKVRVTRLARGLPTGSSLETVSKAVLADSLHGRVGMG